MSIHDYPQDHLMSHIRRVIYLEETTNRMKLVNFLTDEFFFQCLPMDLDRKTIKLIFEVRDTINNLEECEFKEEKVFDLLILLNMYAMENPYKITQNVIKGKCKKIISGKEWKRDGFSLEHLENHELNLKRYEIIKAFDEGKTVTFKGVMLHRLNESCRKVDTEFENGKCLWNMLADYEEFMIYDPTSPEIVRRIQVVLGAFEQGKRVKVNGCEVIPVQGFTGAFHWQVFNSKQYRPLEKIVYSDFPIDIF